MIDKDNSLIFDKYLTLNKERKINYKNNVKYYCLKLAKLYSTHELKYSTWKGLAKEMSRILNHNKIFKTKLQAKRYVLNLIKPDFKNKKIKVKEKKFEPKIILRKKIK